MTVLKANPSVVVDFQAPEFVRSDYAKFITFLQKYYQYLEQSQQALDVLRNLETYNDIDEQDDAEIVSTFYTLFLPDFPQVLKADKKFVLKNIAEFYNSKGSIDSVKSFFRILYGEEVQVYLPKVDVLKLNSGVWNKVFKIKITGLSAGLISQLVNSEVYQIDPINGNKTVKARVVDYDPTNNLLYLSADNVILNFTTTSIVYATNSAGEAVTFSLSAQLGETAITNNGIGYSVGDRAILEDNISNTENIEVDGVTKGYVEDLVILNAGDDYSVFDTVTFTDPVDGERAATARITRTINKDIFSESNAFGWAESEDKLLFEDDFELRQEYGNFGAESSTPNLKITDQSTKNLNTGSISSAEFGFMLESQTDEFTSYTRASYTYNQGMYRAILPRIGATSNYSINWARNEGIAVELHDEELWVGSTHCTTGTPSSPGTVIIEFDTDADYNALDRFELTTRSSTNVPVVSVLASKYTDEVVLDQQISGLSEHQQIGVYQFGQETMSKLYPYSEVGPDASSPILYIRERNTLYGHDLDTTRPWEYRFIFKKNAKVNVRIYVMPAQFDIRSVQILDEDGSSYSSETDDVFVLETNDGMVKVNKFDPATDVAGDEVTLLDHGYLQGELIRYNTIADPITGDAAQTVGGIVEGEIFYCHVVDSDTIKLIPYGTTREAINDSLFRTITAAGASGTLNSFSSFVGAHVTSGIDYTSTDVEDSAISIYARKRSCGSRDLDLEYNLDPKIPTDSDTNLKATYPYTVDNKVYLFQSINESTEYIVMERADFATSDQVNLAMEIDKRSNDEQEGYVTYPYIALEASETSIVHHVNNIDIPDKATVRVSVERKTLQSVDDINRGDRRQNRKWDDYADISPAQELFLLAAPTYNNEYADTQYVTMAYPTETSEYSSGPGEFSNLGSTVMVASSKGNSVYYSDGAGGSMFKYASEFDEQRRISFVETSAYDNDALTPTSDNGPLGVTSGSEGPFATNKKRFFTVGFSLPEELNTNFDMPFEVNLRNVIDSSSTPSVISRDTRNYVSLQESTINGDSVYLLENGDFLAYELNDYGFNSLAQGNLSIMDSVMMLEFFSPSLPASDPKKHLVYYCNRADYTKVSSDVQRTIYQFYNCWSPNPLSVPNTSVKDYTISVRSLHKSDTIIQKVSDTQLLAGDPDNSTVNGTYVSPFTRDLVIMKGQNQYGKYIKFYNNTTDAANDTNSLTPFSLGSHFGSNVVGNELFYNPVTSGTIINSAYNNPINKALMGVVDESNISIARYFDPATAVSSNTINLPQHGFANGSWVRFRADFNGTTPIGLTDDTTYYIKVVDANNIKLAETAEDFAANTFVTFTAFATAGKQCSLLTIPQSSTYNSIKENSFDTRKYVDKVSIIGVDTTSSLLTTSEDHTLRTLNTVNYSTDDTPIGGLVNGKLYYAIFVTETQLRLSLTKEDSLAGVFIPLTSEGTGNHYVEVYGSNGNMLPNSTTKEQVFYTPGRYKNVLRTGDAVVYNDQRKLSPTVSRGTLMYIKDATTGSTESFTLTTAADGSSINFGVSKTTSSNVNVNGSITFADNHTFYTGDEVEYVGASAIGGLTSGAKYYAVVSSAAVLKMASTRQNAFDGIFLTFSSVGSGTQYFYRTNADTASEIAEVVPYSTTPNAGMALNPSTTGTGYEEFTISYSDILQTETGSIDTISLTNGGSYKNIPVVTITTPGRDGFDADIYPVVKDIGGVRQFEILDGGLHTVTRTLRLPMVFLSETITGDFVVGESVKVGSTVIGTLESKRGHYFKILPNGEGTYVALTNTVTGVTSGAMAVVDEIFTGAATASPAAITASTANGSTVNYNGDKQLLNTTTKLQDSYYYQDYSYVVRGSNTFDDWKPYFNKLVHPAGMAVFGEVDYFTTSSAVEKLGNTSVTDNLINTTNSAITTEMTT